MPDEAAHISESQLRQMLGAHPMSMWTTDRDLFLRSGFGTRMASDERPQRKSYERFIGKHVRDFYATIKGVAKVDPLMVTAHESALKGKPCSFVVNVWGRRSHGYAAPLKDEDGAIIGVVGMAIDVTDYKSQ